eukprot:1421771-Amphidinium_carterae.1
MTSACASCCACGSASNSSVGTVSPETASATGGAVTRGTGPSSRRRAAVRASRASVSARHRACRDCTSALRTPPTTGSPKPSRTSCDSVGSAACKGLAEGLVERELERAGATPVAPAIAPWMLASTLSPDPSRAGATPVAPAIAPWMLASTLSPDPSRLETGLLGTV